MMQVLHRRRPLDGELAIRRQAHIGMVFSSETIRGSDSYPNTSQHLGVSENSVPLNPMVNDHYPY